MEFSQDVVLEILNFIRQESEHFGGCGPISFYYTEIPGEYSNQQVGFHLQYCKDKGYVEGQISGDRIMANASLTPTGLTYFQELLG